MHFLLRGVTEWHLSFYHYCSNSKIVQNVHKHQDSFFEQLNGLLNLLSIFYVNHRLVETLTKLSESVGCYKTSLDCKEQLIPFYGQFGFKREDGRNYLCKRFFN